MSKLMLITGLVLVLLVAFAVLAAAALPDNGSPGSSQMTGWSVLSNHRFGPLWVIHLNGECESHGNCSG